MLRSGRPYQVQLFLLLALRTGSSFHWPGLLVQVTGITGHPVFYISQKPAIVSR